MKVNVTAATPASVAGITLAAPADATPEDDALFLYALNQVGVTYDSADYAIARGYEVCDDLAAGLTLNEVALDVWLSTPLSAEGASAFTAAAVAVFCPWRIPVGAMGSGQHDRSPRPTDRDHPDLRPRRLAVNIHCVANIDKRRLVT